jgi:hypothetical protein
MVPLDAILADWTRKKAGVGATTFFPITTPLAILNMSWGVGKDKTGPGTRKWFRAFLAQLVEAGILPIAGAGNANSVSLFAKEPLTNHLFNHNNL